MAIPEKYSHISFVPPAGVKREAARGLAMRREHGRGGTAIGIARARDLSNGTKLSPSTVRRMKAFFDRHASDSKAEGFRPGEPGFPSNGKIADLLWGGRSGEAFANKVVAQMNAADERTYSPDTETAILEEEAVSQRSEAMQGVERRYFGSFDKPEDNSLTVEHRADPATGVKRTYIVGYAAKFGTDSLLLGDFIERLAPTAFDIVKAGKDEKGKPLNTRCLFNHDPNHLLGRFPTTMKMTVDKIGLRYECLLPESRKDIAEMISRGDLRGSSFSFVCAEGGEKWSSENGQSIRTVTKIKALLDCSPVTYPAYDDATVEIAKRSYEAFSSEKKIVEVRSNVASEIEKTRLFLAERRGFCATGPGGGIDNSCGGASGAANKEDSAWREGGKVGAVIGAAVGTIGGAAGIGAGAAIGAVTGAVAGLFGTQSQKPLEDAYKATGTSLAKIDKLAKMFDKQMTVNHDGYGGVTATGGGVTVKIERDEDTGKKDAFFTGDGFPGDSSRSKSAHLIAAGRLLGVDSVSIAVPSSDTKTAPKLIKDGFTVERTGANTTTILTKNVKLPRMKNSKSRRSYEELMKFYESRGFCATGPGGGIDNSCGGSSSGSDQAGAAKQALAKYEAGRKTTTGSLLESAAKGAIIGGIVGSPGGVTGYFAGSITGALLNVVGHGVAAAVGAVASKNLDSLAKSIGVTQDKLSSASSALFGSESKPFALDSKTIAIESGDNIALISSGSQFSKASGTAFHFQPGSDVNGTLDIKAVEKAARAIGAKVVSAEVWSDSDAKSLTSKGYRQVVASPGGFSKSKGVYEKKLSGGKYKRSYDELMSFYQSRGFCPTGSGGGVDNSCGGGFGGGKEPMKEYGFNGGFGGGKSKSDMPNGLTGSKDKTPVKESVGKTPVDYSKFVGSDTPRKDQKLSDNKYVGKSDDDGKQPMKEYGFNGGFGGGKSKSDVPNGLTGSKEAPSKYMEWSKGKDKEAQDFIDKARTEQLSKGGKGGGQSDEGGGVQTWSKGDHFPWTVKQVGDTDGHVQGQHPDGSKTEKYPFKGGKTSDALKKVADEIKRRKSSRADQVVADTLKFLKDRRA
jgi:HK97 family phage prohead protease